MNSSHHEHQTSMTACENARARPRARNLRSYVLYVSTRSCYQMTVQQSSLMVHFQIFELFLRWAHKTVKFPPLQFKQTTSSQMLRLNLLLISSLSLISSSFGIETCLQPVVTVVQNYARRAVGSLSMPEGSPWCAGRPTYWPEGHLNKYNDTPSCLNDDGTWEQPKKAVLDG